MRIGVVRERLLRDASRARGCRILGRLVSYRGQLHSSSRTSIRTRCAIRTLRIAVLRGGLSGSLSLALLILLALCLFFLLALFPFFPNFLEFFWSTLLTMALHRHVSVEMIQRAICLLATIPTALVHALNFFIAPSGSLMLLRSGNWDERVDLIWTLLRCARGRAIHVSWGQWRCAVTTIARPVWPCLRVHPTAWVRVPMSHVGVGAIG